MQTFCTHIGFRLLPTIKCPLIETPIGPNVIKDPTRLYLHSQFPSPCLLLKLHTWERKQADLCWESSQAAQGRDLFPPQRISLLRPACCQGEAFTVTMATIQIWPSWQTGALLSTPAGYCLFQHGHCANDSQGCGQCYFTGRHF